MKNSFVVSISSSLVDALSAIADNGNGCVLVTNSKGQCVGSLSDGDIRKAYLHYGTVDLSETMVADVMNKSYYFVRSGEKITSEQIERFKLIPVLNEKREIIKIKSKKTFLNIGKSVISMDKSTFVIAEIGNNHQGDVEFAKKLVREAVNSGADAVKFQHRNVSETYRLNEIEDLGVEYVKNLLSKYSLSWESLSEVMSFAKNIGIDVICTPFDIRSAAELISFGVDAIKIASADLTNHELIKYCGQSGIPMILSTGMSTELEIIEAAELITNLKSDYAFLHCNSTYPAPYEDVNLRFMNRLKSIGLAEIVGWSGHERGYHVCIAAVAMGAKIIEKHFSLDKSLEGNDHKVSLLPEEFKSMVCQIREVEASLGNDTRIITQGEMINRESLSKSIVAKHDLERGVVISRDMLEFRSPGRGLQPNRVNEVVGKTVVNPVKANDFIYSSTFEDDLNEIDLPEFPNIHFGIPVRFHDIQHSENFGNMVEFHLTLDDLSRNDLIRNLVYPENIKYITVHAPEIFAEDRLLNLADLSLSSFERSLNDMRAVIDLADKLRRKTSQDKVFVVTNVGGWTENGFETDQVKRGLMYERVHSAFSRLEYANVELLVQTMPPYPWHFGGQSFHNLFVDPREIVKQCTENKFKICLDLSHTFLACTFLGLNFYDSVRSLMPFTEHLHVSDAEGLSGEGLQIGTGEINWDRISEIISKFQESGFSVIPEVWQGHKDSSRQAKRGLSIFLNKLKCVS